MTAPSKEAINRAISILLADMKQDSDPNVQRSEVDTQSAEFNRVKLMEEAQKLQVALQSFDREANARISSLRRKRNATVPFYSIPVELVGYISDLVLDVTLENAYFKTLYALCSVSHGWWTTLGARQPLWANVDIHRANVAPEFIRRSGSLPLNLKVIPADEYGDRRKEKQRATQCVSAVKADAHRWKSLHYEGPIGALEKWLECLNTPRPLLQSVFLTSTEYATQLKDFAGGPLLTHLKLFNVVPPKDGSGFKTLTTLHIGRISFYYATASISALQFCPLLQEVEMFEIKENGVQEGGVVSLPTLKTLSIWGISSSFIATVMHRISAPNLQALDVSYTDTGAEDGLEIGAVRGLRSVIQRPVGSSPWSVVLRNLQGKRIKVCVVDDFILKLSHGTDLDLLFGNDWAWSSCLTLFANWSTLFAGIDFEFQVEQTIEDIDTAPIFLLAIPFVTSISLDCSFAQTEGVVKHLSRKQPALGGTGRRWPCPQLTDLTINRQSQMTWTAEEMEDIETLIGDMLEKREAAASGKQKPHLTPMTVRESTGAVFDEEEGEFVQPIQQGEGAS